MPPYSETQSLSPLCSGGVQRPYRSKLEGSSRRIAEPFYFTQPQLSASKQQAWDNSHCQGRVGQGVSHPKRRHEHRERTEFRRESRELCSGRTEGRRFVSRLEVGHYSSLAAATAYTSEIGISMPEPISFA